MADEITYASTTSSQAEIDAALGVPAPKPEVKEVKPLPAVAEQVDAAPEQQEEQQELEQKKEAQQQQKPKETPPYQKRINELTKKWRTTQEQLEDLREENEQLRRVVGSTKQEAVAAQPVIEDKPTRPEPVSSDTKYKTYEEFTKDLGRWSAEQLFAEKEKVRVQEEQNERLKANFDNYNRQLREVSEKYDDFDEVASDKSIVVPKVCELAAIEMENGAEIMYYLGKHADIREQLLRMSDLQVVQELGRLGDYLLSNEEPSEEKEPVTKPAVKSVERPAIVTQVPDPMKPVGGNNARGNSEPDKMPFQDYKRLRRSQGAHVA